MGKVTASAESRKRRILHVISHMEKGGAEKQLRLLVESSRHMHYIAVLIGNERPSSAATVFFYNLNPRHIFRVIRETIQRENIDIVQLWLPERVTIPAMIAAKITRRYIISGDRRKPRNYGVYWLRDRINYINHLSSDMIVPNYPLLSPRISLRRLLRFPRKTRVIYNGVVASERPVSITRTPRKLLFVGRLVEQKRADMLIRAFSRMRDAHGIIELSVVGEGPERNALEQLAASVPGNAIRFHGPRTDWGEVFDPNDYFLVLPSASEGMSNTIFEAMDFGFLPIVSTSPELEEILYTFVEKPVLFDHRSIDSLINAVGDARRLSPEALAARVAGLRDGVKQFSVDRMVTSYDAIYDGI